jgi:hypothetical protein
MQIRLTGFCFNLSLAILFLAAGCDSRAPCVPVSGKVLIDGEPLKHGAVFFLPSDGRQSTGALDGDGHFTLTCRKSNDGALIGTHAIQVFGCEYISNTKMKWHAPKKYSNRLTSGLTQDVKGPTDSVLIELTWKGNTPDKPFMETSEESESDEAFARSKRRLQESNQDKPESNPDPPKQ